MKITIDYSIPKEQRKKSIEYSIEHHTSGGEWVEEGLYFDTYEKALKELNFLKDFMPEEKFRIVEDEYTVLWERS